MHHERLRFSWLRALMAALLVGIGQSSAWAQDIGPAQDQEIADARSAIELAVKDQAEKYATTPLKQSRENLQAAEAARTAKDGKTTSQAARIARAQAELARAATATAIEEERLAQTGEAIRKARQELDSLQKQGPKGE